MSVADRTVSGASRSLPSLGTSVAQHGVVGKVEDDSTAAEEELAEQADVMNRRAFSFMSGEQIRWMSKRKPSGKTAIKPFVPPSRVIQLRSIFKGLDIDGSGEISLQELKDAVRYVAQAKTGSGPPLIKDPEAIAALFESMDIDGNGVVDFEEFVLGMTAPTTDGGPSVKDINALQAAFYDFANQHRRTMIVDKLKDTSIPASVRYDEFRKLYAIKFLRDDDSGALTLEDKIKYAEKEAAAEKSQMAAASNVIRRKEVMRARAASIAFHERHRLEHPVKDGPYPAALKGYIGSTVPILVNKGAGVYRSRKHLQSLGTSKTLEEFKKETMDFAILASQPERLARNMSHFRLAPAPTHTPSLSLTRSSTQLARAAGKEAALMRSMVADARTDILPAPVNVRAAIERRVAESKTEFERPHHHHHHHHHHGHGHGHGHHHHGHGHHGGGGSAPHDLGSQSGGSLASSKSQHHTTVYGVH